MPDTRQTIVTYIESLAARHLASGDKAAAVTLTALVADLKAHLDVS